VTTLRVADTFQPPCRDTVGGKTSKIAGFGVADGCWRAPHVGQVSQSERVAPVNLAL
jgi:hypothetical protein